MKRGRSIIKINREWVVKKPASQKLQKDLSKIHPLILQLLLNREIISESDSRQKNLEKIEEFLEADYEKHLFSPWLLLGMDKAVARIILAIKKKEKIAIYGDYDVDGISATAILKTFFDELNYKVITYIPSRFEEGYGLNKDAIKTLGEKKINLIIAVDCGITAVEEVELANKLGIDVIICDHHNIPKKLPKAAAIINPKLPKCAYPFKELSAAGLAFKLVSALTSKMPQKFPAGWEKWLLDLVVLGTACDVVPLVSENRVLVKYGLLVLKKTKRVGLQFLMEAAGIKPNEVILEKVSFYLGPRLNAAGRLTHAKKSLELLYTKDPKKAEELATYLDQLNSKRQTLTAKVLEEAKKQIAELDTDIPIFILAKEDWPAGVLGIVASKLNQEHHKPVLVLEKGELSFSGSARSIEGFNITEALHECRQYLLHYGGHNKAAGLSVNKKDYEKFMAKLCAIAETKLSADDLMPKIVIDAQINLQESIRQTHDEIKKIEPFGFANFEPVFLSQELEIKNKKLVGKKGSHVQLFLQKEGNEFKSIGFGMAEKFKDVGEGDKIDLVFKFLENNWNGNAYLDLGIIDFKRSTKN